MNRSQHLGDHNYVRSSLASISTLSCFTLGVSSGAAEENIPLASSLPNVRVIVHDIKTQRRTATKKKKVTLQHSIEMRCLHQVSKVSGKALLKMYKKFGYSKSSIYEHRRKPIAAELTFDKRSLNKGRP